MAQVIYYATDDEFKIEQRTSLAKTRNLQIEVVNAVNVGKRATMFKTIEEVVGLKWQMAARSRQKGQILMVDGIDMTVEPAKEAFFAQYYAGKSQEEYVKQVFGLIPLQIKEWPKAVLKSVVAIGIVGQANKLFVGLIEGNVFYRPKLAWNKSLPAILPYIYVMYWQVMLAPVYAMSWEERRQYVTHDHSAGLQAFEWIEGKLLVR